MGKRLPTEESLSLRDSWDARPGVSYLLPLFEEREGEIRFAKQENRKKKKKRRRVKKRKEKTACCAIPRERTHRKKGKGGKREKKKGKMRPSFFFDRKIRRPKREGGQKAVSNEEGSHISKKWRGHCPREGKRGEGSPWQQRNLKAFEKKTKKSALFAPFWGGGKGKGGRKGDAPGEETHSPGRDGKRGGRG